MKIVLTIVMQVKIYVGQSQLIFSAIQGIAEIYKIHGSVEVPESIVINEEDYVEFERKSTYLAAKLMTIFMEYPIIFMGGTCYRESFCIWTERTQRA